MMSHYKIGFSWIAVIIFALPMIINIIYAIFPPIDTNSIPNKTNSVLEAIEQATRILYLLALVFLVSRKTIEYKSFWFILALIFLVLYYVVWIRYFIGGRHIELLGKSFLFIPMPLAIFPVLYFICAAIWMNNYIAVGFMIVFGCVHNIISYMSFK